MSDIINENLTENTEETAKAEATDSEEKKRETEAAENSEDIESLEGYAPFEPTRKEKIIFCLKTFFSPAVIAITVLFLISSVVSIIGRNVPAFADFFNQSISSIFRMVLAKITGILPFSLAETLIISIPFLVVIFLIIATRYLKVKGGFLRPLSFLLSVLMLISSGFSLIFQPAYFAPPVETKLDIERKDLSAEELYAASVVLLRMLSRELKSINFKYKSFSKMPYGTDELSEKISEAYTKVSEKYGFTDSFSSRIKPVALSVPMSYAHTTGMYTYYTGEANLNIDFPDYTLPFTVAHEFSHQRGVGREDDANFMAFLVCIESDDSYIRYSGILNMIEYMLSPLYTASPEYHSIIYSAIPESVKNEMRAYSRFYDKYRESTVSKVSNAVNDAYLKSQGTEGTRSYGMVVDLATAYINGVLLPIEQGAAEQ